MGKNNDETKLDGLIHDAVGGESRFDFAKWKSEHTEEIEAYHAMNAIDARIRSHRRSLKVSAIVTAAAAILVFAFLVWPDIGNETVLVKPGDGIVASSYTPLPAHLPTVGRLNAAFAEGGIDAVEKFCERSERKSGARPGRLTAMDIFIEFEANIETKKGSEYENQSDNNNAYSFDRA
ncbi:MAG: hypothetical protein KAS23_02690 [Anaerohalosphaera sp.]|nr:hypothetical protein [Anaerohalosphaera sp.]